MWDVRRVESETNLLVQRHGRGKYVFANGDKYIGDFSHGAVGHALKMGSTT